MPDDIYLVYRHKVHADSDEPADSDAPANSESVLARKLRDQLSLGTQLKIHDHGQAPAGEDFAKWVDQELSPCKVLVVLGTIGVPLDREIMDLVIKPCHRRRDIAILLVLASAFPYTEAPELARAHLYPPQGNGAEPRAIDRSTDDRLAAELVRIREQVLALCRTPGKEVGPQGLGHLPALQRALLYGAAATTILVVLSAAVLHFGEEILRCRLRLIGIFADKSALHYPLSAVLGEVLRVPLVLLDAAKSIPLGKSYEATLTTVPVGALALVVAVRRRWPRYLPALCLLLAGILLVATLFLTNALRAHHAVLRFGTGGENCNYKHAHESLVEVCSWLTNGGPINQGRQLALAGLWALGLCCVVALGALTPRPWRWAFAGVLVLLLPLSPWAMAMATFRNDFARVEGILDCPPAPFLHTGCLTDPHQQDPLVGCDVWSVSDGATESVLVLALKGSASPTARRGSGAEAQRSWSLILPAAMGCKIVTGGSRSRLLQEG